MKNKTWKIREVCSLPILILVLITSVHFSCKKDEPKPVELNDIIVKTPPTKLDYFLLEKLDFSGIVLELIWSDGESDEIQLYSLSGKDISFSPQNGTELTEKITTVKITHISSGKNTEFEVNVETVLKDIEGNIYNYIKIGEQLWMSENLKTTKLNDGSEIPLVTENDTWNNLVTPGYCWYNNDKESHVEQYGALYNWYSVETGKLCPTGWHVPSDADWYELTYYISNDGQQHGTALKALEGWNNDGNGTDNYGFKALPSGRRDTLPDGFYAIGNTCSWWKSDTLPDSNEARTINAYYDNNYMVGSHRTKNFGLSIRCIRD